MLPAPKAGPPPPARPDPNALLTPGARLGPYEIVESIGSGGMGVVYRAHDARLARDVAVKVVAAHLAIEPEARARFEQEARAIAALSHPNILAIHDIGIEGEVPYTVTELLHGESLRTRLARAPLSWHDALSITQAAAEGLATAHGRGIVHRDLKPENLFLTTDGRLKVLDFGLARTDTVGLPALREGESPTVADTHVGTIVGTVGYLSPEQARGERATPASDVFALGCILFEAVAGRRAFDGATAADRLAAVLNHQPEPLGRIAEVPAELDAIVQRCLQKEAWRRYPTARELASSLETLRSGSGRGSGSQPARRPRSRTRSLAVLPFELSPANPDAEFLSDGLTESIINSLSELPKLRVVPRSTVFRYKALALDVPSVGRELEATYVLTGRVAVRGEALKVQVELVESATNRQLWGRLYTRPTSDLSALQDALAHDISAALKLRLAPQGRRPARAATDNADAYQDFLRGRYFLNQYTPDGFAQAIQCFERAITRDPEFALAHAELANAFGTARFFGYLPPHQSDQPSKDAMDRALELDPLLPEAHSARAKRAFFHDRDWATAQAHFERALELKPDYAECRLFFSLFHAALGRSERALAEGRRATEDTPLFGLIQAGFAIVQIFCGQVEAGIEQARRALTIEPGNVIALKNMWFANLVVERYEEALNALAPLAQALGLPPDTLSRLRTALETGGGRAFTEEFLRVTRDVAARRYVPPHEFMFIYAKLGDVDRVLEYAERCIEINAGMLVFLAVDPCFDPLRADPRFQDLVRRLGLPIL
jgi:serine/threonine protein kinase/Tfp pilus assembly protein PilF